MPPGQPHEALTSRIEQVLADPLTGLGLDVEAVELTPAGKRRVLRVAVDGDDGVTLDDVADATRVVDEVLESGDLMGEQPYTLEVTSRGVDRPLTLPRHWRRNTGRLVKVKRTDGSALTGRVLEHDEDADGGVVLEVSGRPQRLAYADVSRALVQVELNRREPAPGAAADGTDTDNDTETDEEDEA